MVHNLCTTSTIIAYPYAYECSVREMHGLGEKDPIGFSHFVRWVVAQQPASMHRAWRPYARTCRFASVGYTFVGRFETLQEDVERLLGK